MGLVNQFKDLWNPLGANQKVSLMLAGGLVVLAMVALMVWASRPSMQLLYGKRQTNYKQCKNGFHGLPPNRVRQARCGRGYGRSCRHVQERAGIVMRWGVSREPQQVNHGPMGKNMAHISK